MLFSSGGKPRYTDWGKMNKIITITGAMSIIFGVSLPAQADENSNAESASKTTTTRVAIPFEDGGIDYRYFFADGSIEDVPVPPDDFNPLVASDVELSRYGLPSRPIDQGNLAEWQQQMALYKNQGTPDPADVNLNLSVDAIHGTTWLDTWGGYFVGTEYSTSKKYVAIKSTFQLPLVTSECVTGFRSVSAWVGLGGMDKSNSTSLVQQGFDWCSPRYNNEPLHGDWRAFTEFADTELPRTFCNYSTFLFSPGNVVYNNLSYQDSTNTAYFYMENQSTGISHYCSRTAPPGWSYNGATAEWIVEQALVNGEYMALANYGQLTFTNTQVQLGSNSSWVALQSQINTKIVTGIESAGSFSQVPSLIAPDGRSFTMNWIKGVYW
jgi:hypothetical protein